MPTEETAYKTRMQSLMKSLSAWVNLPHWATALGVGAKAGIPDKWFQFGHIPVFFELKRKSAKARKLQEHRIAKLRSMGFVAFCLAAKPDSTGVKGQERQDVYEVMLEQLTEEQVEAYIAQYREDARSLREWLEEHIT